MREENLDLYKARWGQHKSDAVMRYYIYCLGDILQSEMKLSKGGIDAIAIYLSQRDKIPVEKIPNYNTDKLCLLLDKELQSNKIEDVDFRVLKYDQYDTKEGARWIFLENGAVLNYLAACFGDHLAQKEGYNNARDEEAVRLYLIKKYGWNPNDVLSLSLDVIRFLLDAEMKDWQPSNLQSSVVNR